jgi:hypothetical protein
MDDHFCFSECASWIEGSFLVLDCAIRSFGWFLWMERSVSEEDGPRVFTVLYYTFELISIGGLFYEYMKTAGTGQ